MLQQLKIKIKTLATESQFTRQEERRGYDYTKQYLRDIKRKVREQRIEANKLKEQQYQQWKFQHFDPETEELREPFVWEEWKPQDIDLKEIKEIRDELKNSSLAKLQLAELRRVKLRNESRSLQLAYSFLRGKPYKKIEEPYFNVGRNKGRPDFSFIFSI